MLHAGWEMATQGLSLTYSHLKWLLGFWLGVGDDALHCIVGMLALTGAALVLRRPPWTWRPWLVAFALEVANEVFDIWFGNDRVEHGNIPDAIHDLVLTMLSPTLVVFVFRRWGAPPAPSADELDEAFE